MEWIEAVCAALGIKLKVVFFGALGALISLKFFDNLSTWERWVTFGGGLGLATGLTESVFAWLELTNMKLEAGLAVVIGLFGMSIVSALIKTVRETNWSSIVSKKAGGE